MLQTEHYVRLKIAVNEAFKAVSKRLTRPD